MSETVNDHIVFVCSRLDSPGGIERAIANTANLFAGNGLRVSILILDEFTESFYPLQPTIRILQVPLFFGIEKKGNPLTRKAKFVGDIQKLKKEFAELQPSIIIATEYPFSIASVLVREGKARLLAWEHHHYFELQRSAFWNALFRWVYPKLDAVVCLNADEQRLFQRNNKRVVVIPNFCADVTTSAEHPDAQRKRILTIGRLSDVKGIDDLLLVAKEILNYHLDWDWKLIGEGEKLDQVCSFIQHHGLKGRLIHQLPLSHAVSDEYKQAFLYVLTSKNECFPMTLLEAMQNGLACVAFNCETGPRAIIEQGKNGLLIENGNVPAMIDAIDSLIQNPQDYERMGQNALNAVHRFSPQKIFGMWLKLFRSL